MSHAILSAIGIDRPGLVEEVSQFIFRCGGSIQDSRMINLRGQFAMMLLIEGEPTTLAQIEQGIEDVSNKTGLHMQVRPAGAGESMGRAVSRPYRLRVTAMDQMGLVHRVAHLLRSLNVNIERLDTALTAAPITGAPVFEMDLILSIPANTPLAQVRERLGKMCDELNIDWQLSAA